MKPPVNLQEQVSLGPLNTLAVDARARYFLDVKAVGELERALAWADSRQLDVLVLGGGSNLVFAGDYDGLVIHMALRGRHWEQVTDDGAVLVLPAGENWHESVLYAAGAGYRGIENLALIPGTAGAAPVQNIGAYGVELCDSLQSVTVWDRRFGRQQTLDRDRCGFGYRDSLFKHEPGRYIILDIRLRLSRHAPFSLGYGDLKDYLADTDPADLTPLAVARAVMAVRHRKLPDPSVLPNAGSFFKNPIVTEEQFQNLQARHPDLVSYPVEGGVKLAAGWLIDQAGWKGFRNERVGVHNRQALVLINHSQGSGADVLALAESIQASVRAMFGVELEMEPGVIGLHRG